MRISVVNGVFLCCSLIFPGVRLSSDAQFSDFLDGLGPAQLVGRQTLATPPMGENFTQQQLWDAWNGSFHVRSF